MLDEKYGQGPGGEEDEEYHFADEQSGYDMPTEQASTGRQTESPQTAAPGLATRFQERRRIIIGIVVFVLLAGMVYRLMFPSKPAGEIAKTLPAQTPASRPAMPPQETPVMAQAPAAVSSPAPAAVVPVQQGMPVSMQPAGTQPAPVPAMVSGVSGQGNDVMLRAFSARMDSLEQQNTALMNTLQRQVAKSSADAEDLLGLRQQVEQLRAEVSGVTQAFHQLAVLLKARQEENGLSATAPAGRAGRHRSSFRVGYSVQAIIPGRAWLRSAQGETVTVAEGDMLGTVGRVTRIDPYDGTVTLKGSRGTVMLTYGQGEDE